MKQTELDIIEEWASINNGIKVIADVIRRQGLTRAAEEFESEFNDLSERWREFFDNMGFFLTQEEIDSIKDENEK